MADDDGSASSDDALETGSDARETGSDGDTANDANDANDSGLTDPSDALTDPSENLKDPAENVPTPEAPDVGVDGPNLPSPYEVPGELRAEFWEIVLAFNVGLFAVALGAMLVGFSGRWTLGGAALGIGGLALGYGFWQYRTREHTP